MINDVGPDDQAEQTMAEAAETLLAGIAAEPVPLSITMLAHRLQRVLDMQRADNAAAAPHADA